MWLCKYCDSINVTTVLWHQIKCLQSPTIYIWPLNTVHCGYIDIHPMWSLVLYVTHQYFINWIVKYIYHGTVTRFLNFWSILPFQQSDQVTILWQYCNCDTKCTLHVYSINVITVLWHRHCFTLWQHTCMAIEYTILGLYSANVITILWHIKYFTIRITVLWL